MIGIIILTIIDFLYLALGIVYFILSIKLVGKYISFIGKKYSNNIRNYYLLPSLICLLVGLFFIVINIILLVVFNNRINFDYGFIYFIAVGSFIGFSVGIIYFYLLKKEAGNTYDIDVFGSNLKAIIGSSIIFYVSIFVCFAISIYIIINLLI